MGTDKDTSIKDTSTGWRIPSTKNNVQGMKKGKLAKGFGVLMFLFGIMWNPLSTQAQTTERDSVQRDSVPLTELQQGKNKPNARKADESRWLKIGLGVSNFVDEDGFDPGGVEYELNMARSIYVDLRAFGRSVSIVKNTLTLDYALAFDWYNFFFDNNQITLTESDGIVRPDKIGEDDRDLKKSKLTVSYFHIPLALHLETKPEDLKHSFRLEAGGYAGVRLGSHTKVKDEDGDKTKEYRDFQINNFRYGLEGAIGYGPITLFARYDLQPLFDEEDFQNSSNQNVQINPVTLGIRLPGFNGNNLPD